MGIRLVFPIVEKLGVVGKRFSLILPKNQDRRGFWKLFVDALSIPKLPRVHGYLDVMQSGRV
jgi:hypothetical protein